MLLTISYLQSTRLPYIVVESKSLRSFQYILYYNKFAYDRLKTEIRIQRTTYSPNWFILTYRFFLTNFISLICKKSHFVLIFIVFF